jgi:hypothetical protein
MRDEVHGSDSLQIQRSLQMRDLLLNAVRVARRRRLSVAEHVGRENV